MRDHYRGLISDTVYKTCRKHVYHQLEYKIHRDQKGDPGKRDLIAVLKHHKQQRDKIIYHSLDNIPDKAGIHCSLKTDSSMFSFHILSPKIISFFRFIAGFIFHISAQNKGMSAGYPFAV